MATDLKDLKGIPLPDMRLTYFAYMSLCHSRDKAPLVMGTDVLNDLGDRTTKLRKLLFKQLCAYMRERNQNYFSIFKGDFISGLDDERGSFDKCVTWQTVDRFGMPGSCGNGGDDYAQYQISQVEFFTHYEGVWDTRTEKRISKSGLCLYTPKVLITRCANAMALQDYKEVRKVLKLADAARAQREKERRRY